FDTLAVWPKPHTNVAIGSDRQKRAPTAVSSESRQCMGEASSVEPRRLDGTDACREPAFDAPSPRVLGHDDQNWCAGYAARAARSFPTHKGARARAWARGGKRAPCSKDC